MTACRCLATFCTFASVILTVEPLQAAESPPTTSSGTADLGAAEEARLAFRRAVDLYEERDFAAAGVEFRRAYRLAKSFRILYNLGRVAVEQHDYSAALDLFARYLVDGGTQIPSERVSEVQAELSGLRQRVAKVDVDFEDAGATILVDDVEKGHTPLASPLAVNVGRRRLEVRPREGAPIVRWLDVAGGETVRVRLAVAMRRSAQGLGEESISKRSAVGAEQREQRLLWLPWTGTVMLAAGATVAGVVAYRASRDLSSMRQQYPASRADLDDKQGTVRVAGAVCDALAAATVILGALSVYWTLDTDSAARAGKTKTSVAWSWPGVLSLDGHF